MYNTTHFQNCLLSVIKQSDIDIFDKFVDGRIMAHNSYDWNLVKTCDFDLIRVGFIEKENEFYVSTKDELIVMEINEDFSDINEVFKHKFDSIISSIAQNPVNKENFVISLGKSILTLNIRNGEQTIIPCEEVEHKVSWINDNSFVSVDKNVHSSVITSVISISFQK